MYKVYYFVWINGRSVQCSAGDFNVLADAIEAAKACGGCIQPIDSSLKSVTL